MLLWDIRWNAHRHKVANLNAHERFVVGVLAVENVLALQGKDFITNESPQFRSRLDTIIACLKQGNNDFCDELETYCQGDLSAGMYDLLMAILLLCRSIGDDFDSERLLETLSYCYQSILDSEIISKLERDMTESDVNKLEEVNAKCVRCIDDQIGLMQL